MQINLLVKSDSADQKIHRTQNFFACFEDDFSHKIKKKSWIKTIFDLLQMEWKWSFIMLHRHFTKE